MRTVAHRLALKYRVDEETGCWLWIGATARGYGQIWVDGRTQPAHRIAYELLVGPIPEGLQLDHLCRVRHCVNPEHLEPVTNRENILRGVSIVPQNAAKTHCPQNHPYDDANTYYEGPARWRRCLTCKRERQRLARVAA